MERPEIEVIVVDNDASESANQICAEVEPKFQWKT